MKVMADSLGDLGWSVEDRILVLNVLRGLSDRYAYFQTWITRQRPFPTFRQVLDDLAMEELTQRLQPKSTSVSGSSSSSTALTATPPRPAPPPPSSLLGPLPPGPSRGVGGHGGRRHRGKGRGAGRGGNTTPPTPRGAPWPSFHNPWSGRISMWSFQTTGGEPRPPAAMLASAPPGFPLATSWAAVLSAYSASTWAPPPGTSLGPTGWDQAALANSFSTMALTPPVGPEWVADSGATYHTTPNPGILSSVHPPSSSLPSSIMVANGSCLPITFVGAACPHGSFRLPGVLVAPSMVHNLLSIRHFTNSCSVEFDSSGLTVKDLASRRPLHRCDSTGPLYTLRFLASASPSSSVLSVAFATTTSSTTWYRRLGHPGRDALMQLSRSSDIRCTRPHDEHLCHACQLGRHVHLPFHSSSHVPHFFDLVHCDLWTSPVINISGYKYYLVVVDDYSHYS